MRFANFLSENQKLNEFIGRILFKNAIPPDGRLLLK